MDELSQLADFLRERRRIIADHAWRDGDAAGHLAALGEISGRIEEAARRLGPAAPPRLRHFLESCSFDKALAWLESSGAPPVTPPR